MPDLAPLRFLLVTVAGFVHWEQAFGPVITRAISAGIDPNHYSDTMAPKKRSRRPPRVSLGILGRTAER